MNDMSWMEKTTDSKEKNSLDSILQGIFGDGLKVVNYTTDNLLPSGENFRSSILKVIVQVRRTKDSPIENLYFIAKTIPTVVLEILKQINWVSLFEKEIYMYTNIIPFYSSIELEKGIDEKKSIFSIFPKLYAHPIILALGSENDKKDTNIAILLEDLKIQGYYVSDKKIGMYVNKFCTSLVLYLNSILHGHNNSFPESCCFLHAMFDIIMFQD